MRRTKLNFLYCNIHYFRWRAGHSRQPYVRQHVKQEKEEKTTPQVSNYQVLFVTSFPWIQLTRGSHAVSSSREAMPAALPSKNVKYEKARLRPSLKCVCLNVCARDWRIRLLLWLSTMHPVNTPNKVKRSLTRPGIFVVFIWNISKGVESTQ